MKRRREISPAPFFLIRIIYDMIHVEEIEGSE